MITQELLKSRLHYDPNTGIFTWLQPKSRSKQKPGDRAGDFHKASGYIRIGVEGGVYKAHRLAWLYTYGYLPELSIDHIDQCRHNNAISNLRLVTVIENAKNQKLPSNNTSGVIGVTFNSIEGTYVARISVDGARVHLGSFTTIEEAASVRKEAEIVYGYHTNHGLSRGTDDSNS